MDNHGVHSEGCSCALGFRLWSRRTSGGKCEITHRSSMSELGSPNPRMDTDEVTKSAPRYIPTKNRKPNKVRRDQA